MGVSVKKLLEITYFLFLICYGSLNLCNRRNGRNATILVKTSMDLAKIPMDFPSMSRDLQKIPMDFSSMSREMQKIPRDFTPMSR